MTERDRTYDGRIIAALRDLAASLHARGIDRTTLALDELDALLDAAAERDALKAEGCAMPDEIHLEEGDVLRTDGVGFVVDHARTITIERRAEPRVVEKIGAICVCGGRILKRFGAWCHASPDAPVGCIALPHDDLARAPRTPTAKSTKPYDCLHDPACRWGGHSASCLNANA